MKILIYKWNSLCDDIAKANLKEMGHEVIEYSRKCEHYTKDLDLAYDMINFIHDKQIDAVFSFDYFPIISMVCNTVKINYYCWVYDSPHLTLYAKTILYPYNKIACFDKDDYNRLTSLGINTVKHLPLSVDDRLFKTNNKKYTSDISFVGNLYTDKHNYYDLIKVDSSVRKRMDEIVSLQQFVYDKDFISEFWNVDNQDELFEYICELLKNNDLLPGDEFFEDVVYIFNTSVLEKKVTVEERRKLLNEVAGLGYDFRLYTGSDLSDNKLLKSVSRGYVDYKTQMPSVFAQSKINLNITLRSIHTGVPLRVMDILGCGGFVLTNYQEEIVELFKENEEIVIYRSLEECVEKINYYLEHEEERSRIAINGKKAVRERFNYKLGLEKLLSL